MRSIPRVGTAFFFNDTAPTEIYTLSLHDALPIFASNSRSELSKVIGGGLPRFTRSGNTRASSVRSEEHTSELQSLRHLVCRLLLEKKKKTIYRTTAPITCNYF